MKLFLYQIFQKSCTFFPVLEDIWFALAYDGNDGNNIYNLYEGTPAIDFPQSIGIEEYVTSINNILDLSFIFPADTLQNL